MAKYKTYTEQSTGWTEWVQPIPEGYKMACCDCGLVHNLDFRVFEGNVQFRASRNARATAAKRRKKA